MEDLNQALVIEQGWEMMANKDCIWVNALAAKYCRGNTLLKAREYHGVSWIWQSLMHTRKLVDAGFYWGIKTRREIDLWSDPWMPGLVGYTPKLKWGTTVDRNLNKV